MNHRQHSLICDVCFGEFLGWKPTQRYCSRKCVWASFRFTEADFWRLVDKSPRPKGCWLYTGSAYDNGGGISYGKFGAAYAHRYAYERYHPGVVLTSDDLICHTCDIGLCVHKDHLFKGTCQDNMDDARSKGRISQGSKHPGVTTTEEVVKKIWDEWQREGRPTLKVLAQKYDVSFFVAMHIVSGTTWKHVTRLKGL